MAPRSPGSLQTTKSHLPSSPWWFTARTHRLAAASTEWLDEATTWNIHVHYPQADSNW